VDHFSWRWIFLVNPLIALPTIWIAYRRVPESRDPDAKMLLSERQKIAGLAAALRLPTVYGYREFHR
jgi:predicted MFS family arabinose efflux permease